MTSDPALSSLLAVLGGAISTVGAIYVGWRNRTLNHRLARFQEQLADVVLKRQLCLALGSRALMVGERAAEVRRSLDVLARARTKVRIAEMEKRTERLDRACDALLESWTEVANWGLASDALRESVDRLNDTLETLRLGMLLTPGDNHRHAAALSATEDLATNCQRACRDSADKLVSPSLA